MLLLRGLPCHCVMHREHKSQCYSTCWNRITLPISDFLDLDANTGMESRIRVPRKESDTAKSLKAKCKTEDYATL